MADSTIGSLPAASALNDSSLLVVEQLGTAMKLTGLLLKQYAQNAVQPQVDAAGASAAGAEDSAETAATKAAAASTYASNAAQSAQAAAGSAEAAETASAHYPKISETNDHWLVWDGVSGAYVDTGILAEGKDGAKGTKGDPGADAPTITSITIRQSDYHLIVTLSDGTNYDAGYCRGQAGAGTGDMNASVYDPQGKAQDIFAYADTKQPAISDLDTIRSNASAGASKVSCTDETVAGFGYTKNTGTYSKPSGGIPKTDLASDVQTSLSNSHTHSNKTVLDTITGSETWTFTLSDGTTVTKKVVVV